MEVELIAHPPSSHSLVIWRIGSSSITYIPKTTHYSVAGMELSVALTGVHYQVHIMYVRNLYTY